jgi:hypothetical protein
VSKMAQMLSFSGGQQRRQAMMAQAAEEEKQAQTDASMKATMEAIRESAPMPKPAAPAPDSNGPAMREAQRRRVAALLSRGGRQSTLLSGGGGSGQDYSSGKLG